MDVSYLERRPGCDLGSEPHRKPAAASYNIADSHIDSAENFAALQHNCATHQVGECVKIEENF
ncbi:MAG: hypothetical protein ACR650_16365 [Methylocystis sp.]|jgi:hypothetical protein